VTALSIQENIDFTNANLCKNFRPNVNALQIFTVTKFEVLEPHLQVACLGVIQDSTSDHFEKVVDTPSFLWVLVQRFFSFF
jgi:hypothetical protein